MKSTLLKVIAIVVLILVAMIIFSRCDGDDRKYGHDWRGMSDGAPGHLYSGGQLGGITVQATGVALVVPDAVNLSLTVSALADSSEAALALVADAADKVRSAIKSEGVDEKDISTLTVSVYPEYNYSSTGGQTLVGYRASQSFAVVVHKADTAGSVVDAVVAAGGDAVQINGATPVVLETSDSAKKARADAIENARAKAEDYAKLMGIDLGDVISITEVSAPISSFPSKNDMAGPESPAATKIDLGEQQITVMIEVRWSLN